MINTTFWFRSMFKVGSVFMPDYLVSKTIVVGADYQKTLLEYVFIIGDLKFID